MLHPWAHCALPHLYQHVGCIVEAHDQRSHPGHVVDVGEGDEGDGRQVVQEHDQKVLGTARKEGKKSVTAEGGRLEAGL